MDRFSKLKAQTRSTASTSRVSISSIEDMQPINGYVPTRKQRQAHRTRATYVLYGGSVGGGKTAFIVNESIFHCLKYPGARVLMCRNELVSFRRTTLLTLLDFLPLQLVLEHNKTECVFHFKNGSQLYYTGLGDDINSIQKLKSMELSMYAIDQAEETTEQFFHMLNSRLRLSIPNIKYKAFLTCNPTSGWIRDRWIDTSREDHAFIAALPSENPHLPSDYEENLRKILPEELVAAWVEGNWDLIASDNAVFKYSEIQNAMNRTASMEGDEVIGCDPARYGADESIIARKRGNCVTFEDIFSKKSTMETTGRIIRACGDNREMEIRIDSIGIGAGIADRLKEEGFSVTEVVASERATNEKRFKNRRAEIFWNLRDLLPTLSIPTDEKLRAQMTSLRYRIFSSGQILIESKDEIRRRGLTSPDRLDAVAIVCSGEGKGGDYILDPPLWILQSKGLL